jgi:hypothetical protein
MDANSELALSVPLPHDAVDWASDDGEIRPNITKTALEHVPDAVLAYLLQFAVHDLRGWADVQLVSKRFSQFRNIVALTIPEPEMRWVSLGRLEGLRQLQVNAYESIQLKTFLTRLDLRALESLSLRYVWEIADDSLEVLATLPKLTSFNYCGEWPEIGVPRGLEVLGRMQHLTALDLDWVKVGDIGAEVLARLTGLVRLSLHDCDVSDKVVIALSQMKTLHSLSLRRGGSGNQGHLLHITNVGVSYIGRMLDLTLLRLIGFTKITNEGVASLASLVHLVHLDLSGCDLINDDGLNALSGLVALRRLYLGHISALVPGMSDAGLPELAHLVELEVLDVKYCDVTGTGFASLTPLTALTALDCGWCPISNRGLEIICRLTSLEALCFEYCAEFENYDAAGGPLLRRWPRRAPPFSKSSDSKHESKQESHQPRRHNYLRIPRIPGGPCSL